MDLNFPIHHVIVIGFHHKKGCQIEYSFPPLEGDIEKSAWKHLPTLAMPDGAHNFEHDTVYFHLPSLKNDKETVFGVACYQQIDATKLKNKPDDVTRSTVQKSVCVLSKYPLYGHIQVKMALITAAYFREGDFDQVSILEEAFHNLNACLTSDLLDTPEAFVGLSPRELVFVFRHQIITLFKLLLLEKRILFRGASVGPLCSALLTVISLLPFSLEYGLNQSACAKTAKTLSIVPQFSHQSDDDENMDTMPAPNKDTLTNKNTQEAQLAQDPLEDNNKDSKVSSSSKTVDNKRLKDLSNSQIQLEADFPDYVNKRVLENSSFDASLKSPDSEATEASVWSERSEETPDFITAVQMSASDAGLPLQLFTKGYLCHPYLSLHYMDLLTDSRVRGFVVGATNILFKQKKDLVDVIVEMQDGSIDIIDPILKKNVTPTTQDLRFAENIVKQVTAESGRRSDGDTFLDGVGWEGGDEWIRAQFKYYLMCLMRTSLTEEISRHRDSFGTAFLVSWQNTYHWKKWNEYVNSEERDTPGVYALCPGHPFDGHISMSDMKLRISHSMNISEGGRRINQAVLNTGKAVASTGKVVGGAFSQAKGALTSWWSTVTTPTATTHIGEATSSDSVTSLGNEAPIEQEMETIKQSSQPVVDVD